MAAKIKFCTQRKNGEKSCFAEYGNHGSMRNIKEQSHFNTFT